jgi:hypothetical protein
VTDTPTLTVEWDGDRGPFAKAFVAAQKATEAVKKANTNPAFRSKYADLSGVVEAVVPALNANGIGVIQMPGFDGELVSLTTEMIHESGASVRSVLRLKPTKADPQGVGSAITYARRYSLLAMTGAAPEDDDGNEASKPAPANANGNGTGGSRPQPTLAERAAKVETAYRSAETPAALRRARDLAEGLRKDLDRADPERLVTLDALYDERLAALEAPAEAAA